MLRSLQQENSTLSASIGFIPAQLVIGGPVLPPFWLGGLRRLFDHPFARPLALAYITLVVLDTADRRQAVLPRWHVLRPVRRRRTVGRGSPREMPRPHGRRAHVRPDDLSAIRRARLRRFPSCPSARQAKGPWESKIDKDLSATVGWDRGSSRQIAGVAAALPPAERAHVVIFTGDYGAAGAVDLYGSRYGLPHAISGHNNYWWWGPARPPTGDHIAVNLDRAYLQTIFAEVLPAGTVDTGHGVWTEERGDPIWICRHQKLTWAQAWPSARHYG